MSSANLAQKKVAIYARFSSNLQNCASVDDQLYRCRKYIEDHGGQYNADFVFSDSAISGASLQRAGFERLMGLVRSKQVDAVVVEDMSRVSRDMADSATLYRELEYLGVAMIGVADGIDTSQKGSKLSYNVKAMMADFYLEDLRDKTLRGLEGRARAGYSTGGLPYGYTSEPDLDEYGKSRGSRVVVDEEQAKIVVRIFNLYLQGHSLADIAGMLNAEDVPPPRAKSRHRKKGWVDTTIRMMLRNESYIGWRTFKKREWRKVPGTNSRRPRSRPESEVMREHYEDRRIIDEDLWAAVHQRLDLMKRKYASKTGKATGQKNRFPLSGLLHCSDCGSPMVINRGTHAAYYMCGAAKKRKTCKNRQSFREDRAREKLFSALERQFTSPEAIAFLRRAIVDELKRMNSSANADLRDHEERLGRTKERLATLVDFIASGNTSPTVASTISDLEAQAATEKGAIEAIKARAAQPTVLPSPDLLLAKGLQLRETLEGDPLSAREHLRHLFRGQGITMTPLDDGSYVAQGKYYPLLLLSDPTSTKAQCPEGGPSRHSTLLSCAGRI